VLLTVELLGPVIEETAEEKAGRLKLVMAARVGEAHFDGETYKRNLGTRLINSLFRLLTRLGLGASHRHILTVSGRKTGRPYSTPVDVIEVGNERWLVAGYGPASWVKSVRAAGLDCSPSTSGPTRSRRSTCGRSRPT
jgi:F420H(2)-dependent quinone reductase